MYILLLHDSQKLPLPECSFIADDGGAEAVDVAIYEVKLRLVLCGHLHMSSYTIYRYEYGTLYVRIDSSQKHRVCSVLYTGGGKLEIWRDREVLEEQDL